MNHVRPITLWGRRSKSQFLSELFQGETLTVESTVPDGKLKHAILSNNILALTLKMYTISKTYQ